MNKIKNISTRKTALKKTILRKLIHLPFIFFSGFLFAQDSTQHIIPGRSNRADQLKKPYIILISADGFRYDLADKNNAENLIRLRSSGVAADYMLSVFPSLTFPNHYSIATGDYPDHDGIVDNTFYDPSRDQIYTIGNRKAVGDSSRYGELPYGYLLKNRECLQPVFTGLVRKQQSRE